jgi:hypothetical protein
MKNVIFAEVLLPRIEDAFMFVILSLIGSVIPGRLF